MGRRIGAGLIGLAVLQQSNALMDQLTSSSALIDQSVKYIDPSSNAEIWGRVESVKISAPTARGGNTITRVRLRNLRTKQKYDAVSDASRMARSSNPRLAS